MAKNDKKVELANPITGHAYKLMSLFRGARGVETKFNFKKHTVFIYVENDEQAVALNDIIKHVIELGNLQLDIKVYCGKMGEKAKALKPTGLKGKMTSEEMCKKFAKAFFGNKFVAKIMSAVAPDGNVWWFVLGKKDVCQFQNDDIQNPWLVTSCLPEEILKQFFTHTGVQISTVVKVDMTK